MDLTNTVLIIGGLFLIVYAMYLISELEIEEEDTTHHDNRKGSYYYESQKALREKRDELIK